MTIAFAPMTRQEFMYANKQSAQISGQTGFVGYLKGSLDKSGNFIYSWETYRKDLHTEKFINEFQKIFDKLKAGIISSKSKLYEFCATYKDSQVTDFGDLYYGTTVKNDEFTHLILFYDDTVTIHSYKTAWFYQHLHQASNGVRFITVDYNDICRIEDGGIVHIQSENGNIDSFTCRYIDEYHLEICDNIYHICEFAEFLEKGHRKILDIKEERN